MKVVCKEEKHVSYSTSCEIDKFCCKKMKRMIHKLDSGFSLWKWGSDDNIIGYRKDLKNRIVMQTYDHDYWEDGNKPEDDYQVINFCPFCGEKIE